MGEVVLLALATAVNPTLLAVTTVMLLLPHAGRLMLGYWAGAMVVSVSLGLAIVFALNDSGVVSTTKHTLSPLGDFVLAGIMLICAVLLARSDKEERQGRRTRRPRGDKAPRWQEALDKRASAKVTFVLGVLLSLPGFAYLIGLNAITELHYSDAATVFVVIGFNLVQFLLIEGPIVAFKVAPERTPAAIEQAKAAVRTHARSYAARGLLVLAVLLAIKGVIAIV
jgi:Sap, sulfolipid-1-addressing protein